MSFTIKYDAQKNRVYIKVQSVTEANAQEYIDEFTKVMGQVKPGFTGVTDVTESPVLAFDITAKLAPTMEVAVAKGLSQVKKWAYVTDPGNAIYKLQWKRMFADQVQYCESLAEADAYLDGK